MKKLLLFAFLLQQLSVHAQHTPAQTEAMKNPKFFYGYVDGVRLDSINTKYAQVEFNEEHKGWPLFKYGLDKDWPDDIAVRDSTGSPYYFRDYAMALNFFYFNGWEYVNTIPTKPERTILILRKREL